MHSTDVNEFWNYFTEKHLLQMKYLSGLYLASSFRKSDTPSTNYKWQVVILWIHDHLKFHQLINKNLWKPEFEFRTNINTTRIAPTEYHFQHTFIIFILSTRCTNWMLLKYIYWLITLKCYFPRQKQKRKYAGQNDNIFFNSQNYLTNPENVAFYIIL